MRADIRMTTSSRQMMSYHGALLVVASAAGSAALTASALDGSGDMATSTSDRVSGGAESGRAVLPPRWADWLDCWRLRFTSRHEKPGCWPGADDNCGNCPHHARQTLSLKPRLSPLEPLDQVPPSVSLLLSFLSPPSLPFLILSPFPVSLRSPSHRRFWDILGLKNAFDRQKVDTTYVLSYTNSPLSSNS